MLQELRQNIIRFVPVNRLEQVLHNALLAPRHQRPQGKGKSAVTPHASRTPAGLVTPGEQRPQQSTLRQ